MSFILMKFMLFNVPLCMQSSQINPYYTTQVDKRLCEIYK